MNFLIFDFGLLLICLVVFVFSFEFVVLDEPQPGLSALNSQLIETGLSLISDSLLLVFVKIVVVFGHQCVQFIVEKLKFCPLANDQQICKHV
jgi:hypothetical protein